MNSRPAAVLFDLGNTLAAYYRRDEFAPILQRAVAGAHEHLLAVGHAVGAFEPALVRAAAENREAVDLMKPVLIDRDDRHPAFTGLRIRNLHELVPLLQ